MESQAKIIEVTILQRKSTKGIELNEDKKNKETRKILLRKSIMDTEVNEEGKNKETRRILLKKSAMNMEVNEDEKTRKLEGFYLGIMLWMWK